ncbi:MAG: hypothetical protein WCD35_15740, partial [Mycobacteriales bacterium]
MSPTAARRATAGSALAAFLGASALAAVPGGPVLQAVVSYDGRPAPLPGIHLVASLPALHMAVVRGSAAALAQAAGTPGVRGIAP